MESFTLPLADSRIVQISALSMQEVTSYVAPYNMTSALARTALNCLKLMRSFFLLPTGLSIAFPKLHSASGKQGVIWGVHKSWDHMGPSANAAFLVREELKSSLSHFPADN